MNEQLAKHLRLLRNPTNNLETNIKSVKFVLEALGYSESQAENVALSYAAKHNGNLDSSIN
jgi:hypothetical protein